MIMVDIKMVFMGIVIQPTSLGTCEEVGEDVFS